MTSRNHYDVLILGGGPAGLSTALHLANESLPAPLRLLILEKDHYPRPKLCGGGLVLDAEVILERLGLDPAEVPHVDVSTIHFDFAGEGLTFSIPERHALRIIRRDEFDAWLAGKVRAAGMEIREGVTVKAVTPQEGEVWVETNVGEFRAQVVVGADGSNGVTRRCVFPEAPANTARLLEVLAPTDKQEQALRLHGVDHAYFEFWPVSRGIAGYIWDFPTQIKGMPTRCWGIYDTNLLAHQKRPALKALLKDEMQRDGFSLERYELKGHPIRWFSPFHPLSAHRVLLVGDAAGADPLFGEGISMALGYGRLAAQALAEAFTRHDFSFRRYRQKVLSSSLGQTLLLRWVITQILYHFHWEWFQKRFWHNFQPLIWLVGWKWVLNWGKRL